MCLTDTSRLCSSSVVKNNRPAEWCEPRWSLFSELGMWGTFNFMENYLKWIFHFSQRVTEKIIQEKKKHNVATLMSRTAWKELLDFHIQPAETHCCYCDCCCWNLQKYIYRPCKWLLSQMEYEGHESKCVSSKVVTFSFIQIWNENLSPSFPLHSVLALVLCSILCFFLPSHI